MNPSTLTVPQLRDEIARINGLLFDTKQALIKAHGSWRVAEKRGDLSSYRQLLKERKGCRNVLALYEVD